MFKISSFCLQGRGKRKIVIEDSDDERPKVDRVTSETSLFADQPFLETDEERAQQKGSICHEGCGLY